VSGKPQVVLSLDKITKRFGGLVANDAISLTLHEGEVLALLGENGAGKTTLMNILFGHYVADAGEVQAFGKRLPPGLPRAALAAGIGMVHQHFTLCDNLTVLENITLGTEGLLTFGRGRAAASARVDGLARDFGLAVDPIAKVGALSVGQRQRVEILKALYRDARILILDEPTAVLTPQESDALFATLRLAVARGLSVIFISHKLHEVMGIADTCVVLRHGRVVGRVVAADTSRAALAAMMVGAEMPERQTPPGVAGPVRLRLNGVRAPGLRDISLDLRAGQITGLAGVSGNGQSQLAALIGGEAVPETGVIEVDGRPVTAWTPRAAIALGVGRIPEDRHKTGTIADFTLAENAALETYATRFARGGLMDWAAVRAHAANLITAHDVRCEGVSQRIRLLSGGNMQKLILGRVLDEGPGIILANQPVRGLDVGAIAHVHGSLIAARDAGAAVLLISEDLDEVMGLSDVIHVMSGGRLSPPFARGTMDRAGLGLWMAGQGFAHAA
jgi:ABC-type uncharacterized transport system ATPase subunit